MYCLMNLTEMGTKESMLMGHISDAWFGAAADPRRYQDFLNEFDLTHPSQVKFSWIYWMTIVHNLQN
jgi:hypothetical protein